MSEKGDRVSSGYLLLVFLAMLATFALITLGGIVRVTGSGLGCPDWPLCHGRLVPSFDFQTLVEYSHRLTASMVSVLVVLTGAVAWWRYRDNLRLVWPASLAVVLLVVEVVLGGITVLTELPPAIVTVHLAVAQGIFGLLGVALAVAWQGLPEKATASAFPVTVTMGRLPFWAEGAALGTYLVTLSGSYVVGGGATAACLGWPLCDGGLWPAGQLAWVHMVHRLLAGVLGIIVLRTAVLAWRQRARSRFFGWISLLVVVVFTTQMLAGAANLWFGFAPLVRVVHLALATALWGSLVVLATVTGPWPLSRGAALPVERRGQGGSSSHRVIADYLSLIKPRIIGLLLLTALGGMILAAEGMPAVTTLLAVLVGGTLAAGGASAINQCLEQDIDRQMERTRHRPVASRRVAEKHAWAFGLALNALGFLVLWTGANLLSALLAMAGSLFYILVYTLWLKRSTPQNIVIGGAAGAMPPLVGWAAVTGDLSLPAFYLFAIVFFWTPAHFWALALLMRHDYAQAGIPMLPVVEGEAYTRWAILAYTLLVNVVALLFFTVTPSLGVLYLGGALVLGGVFTFYAVQLFSHRGLGSVRRLFRYSLMYLALLFVVIMADGSL